MRLLEQPWFVVIGAFSSIMSMIAGLPITFLVLLGMMIVDMVVGLLRAGLAGEINSRKAYEGGIRKAIMLAVMGAVYLIQIAIASATSPYLIRNFPELPTDLPLTEIVASYYIVYFLISILENSVSAGVPLPDILIKVLKIEPALHKESVHVTGHPDGFSVVVDSSHSPLPDVEDKPTHHLNGPIKGIREIQARSDRTD